MKKKIVFDVIEMDMNCLSKSLLVRNYGICEIMYCGSAFEHTGVKVGVVVRGATI